MDLSNPRQRCCVEGQDDLNTIIHLLKRHNIKLDIKSGPVQIHNSGSVTKLLDSIPTEIKSSTDSGSIGFVVDANSSLSGRWHAICSKMSRHIQLPEKCPDDGYIGTATELNVQVGVWVMPDCNTDTGKLENLIQTLIPTNDPLFSLAVSSTNKAKINGAKFSEPDQIKARLHTWLAWQKNPGLPYGTAIQAKFFDHESETAVKFVKWFKRLFQIV